MSANRLTTASTRTGNSAALHCQPVMRSVRQNGGANPMKSLRVVMAGMLCSTFLFGLGLIGCGRDDKPLGTAEMSCTEALEQELSQDCQDATSLASGPLKICAVDCGEDDQCIQSCSNDFVAATDAACQPGGTVLMNHCGECYVDCGDENRNCFRYTEKTGVECFNEYYECLLGCASAKTQTCSDCGTGCCAYDQGGIGGFNRVIDRPIACAPAFVCKGVR